jgi:hypothetical protein
MNAATTQSDVFPVFGSCIVTPGKTGG